MPCDLRNSAWLCGEVDILIARLLVGYGECSHIRLVVPSRPSGTRIQVSSAAALITRTVSGVPKPLAYEKSSALPTASQGLINGPDPPFLRLSPC